MNLEECRNIINFDLPWIKKVNPGLIGEKIVRPPPAEAPSDRHQDRLLDLEMRVRLKLPQAAASVGVEATPIQCVRREPKLPFRNARGDREPSQWKFTGLFEAGGTAGAALQRRGVSSGPAQGSGSAGGRRCASCPGRPAPEWCAAGVRGPLLARASFGQLYLFLVVHAPRCPLGSSASWERACG